MPLVPNNDSVNSAALGQNASPFEPEKTAGKAGSRKVDTVDAVEPSIPISEGGQAASSELTENVKPAEAKAVLGTKDVDSMVKRPEEQLNAILSDQTLARSYKEQAKDTYLNASEYAFSELQSFVGEVDSGLDSKKMAKAYKAKLKTIRRELKSFERDASDLKVTVTTRDGSSIQLIPFKLKDIDPGELKGLLGIAMALTKETMEQRPENPGYMIKGMYEEKISSCESQTPPLLQQVDDKAKETFESSFKLLKFPRIELHFDSSDSRPVEKTQEKSSSPDSTKQSELKITNTGEFYDGKVDDESSEVNPQTLGPEELELQKNIENAQAQRKGVLRNDASEYTEENEGNDKLLAQDLKKTLSAIPYSNWEGGANKPEEDGPNSDGGKPSRNPPKAPSNEHFQKWLQKRNSARKGQPKNSKPDSQPVPGSNKPRVPPTGTSLLDMSADQVRSFKEQELWSYMTPDQVVKMFMEPKSLIPKSAYEAVKGKANVGVFDALKKDVRMPTFEALVETMQQHVPLPLLINVAVEHDGAGLFRALFAYVTGENKWISSETASKADVCEMIKSDAIALNITSAIESAVEKYQNVNTETEAWQTVVQKLKENDGSADIVSRIFNVVIANGEFSGKSSDDLADLLYLKPLITDGDDNPYAVELGTLAQFMYEALLSELGVPMSSGNEVGIRSENGHFSLVTTN
ncbi:hypothetical protein [Endozoicomonas sp.]|uniref:hypothetical protein n=1 Tax=Endozoicomonas sp. TaxID=1892382 RepID=UPI002884C077|nr:hypothetical protein [Endozoicomonas sp.]